MQGKKVEPRKYVRIETFNPAFLLNEILIAEGIRISFRCFRKESCNMRTKLKIDFFLDLFERDRATDR